MRPAERALWSWVGPALALALGVSFTVNSSNSDQTMTLIWVLLVISVAGALATFGVLVYALIRFRDPATKGRRYG